LKFNPDATYIALGVSYDWAQGFESERKSENSLIIMSVADKFIQPHQ
jgi:hypothetical protein